MKQTVASSLLVLVLVMVGGGAADNEPGCEVLVLKNSTVTPLRYRLSNSTPVLITVPPLHVSFNRPSPDDPFISPSQQLFLPISNLDFIFSTEEENLHVKMLNSSTVRCQRGSQEATEESVADLDVGDGGWWRSVEVGMHEDGQVMVGGVGMCGGLTGARPTLGINASRQTVVAINCGHDCLELNDTAITALTSLPSHTAIHLRANSENSKVKLLQREPLCYGFPCDDERHELELLASRSDIEGQWQRLLIIDENLPGHSRYKHGGSKTTVVVAGSKTKVFSLGNPHLHRRYPFYNSEIQVRVTASVRITWAIGCPESHFYEVHHPPAANPTLGNSDGWNDFWMILALLCIVSFLLLLITMCIILAVHQRRALKKKTAESECVTIMQPRNYNQHSHQQASANIKPNTTEDDGYYYTASDLLSLKKECEQSS